MADKFVKIPTAKEVFLAKLHGDEEPFDLTGCFADADNYRLCIDELCTLGILHRSTWGIFVAHPIAVTEPRLRHNITLDYGQQIQEYGVFYGKSPTYKQWAMSL